MHGFVYNGYIVCMIDENETGNLSVIKELLRKTGLTDKKEGTLRITSMSGDGSSRKFWRVASGSKSLCLAVAPPSDAEKDLAEAHAARSIGLHLLHHGVRVPEQYGWDNESGLLLFEDLGDCKLHEFVMEARGKKRLPGTIRPLYTRVVKDLARMQVRGAEGFDTSWCWDTPRYDKNLMLERESGYFLRAFWKGLLGQEEPQGLQEEFVFLAEKAAAIPAVFFLHRDFQSRNIMIYNNQPCFIDFQGGRPGPLAYDLASLLIDPYVALPDDFQIELLEAYLDELEKLITVDRKKFIEEYLLLALHRNLQIVGAFSFLSTERKKVFFRQYIEPALVSLNKLLDCEIFSDMQVLKKIVSKSSPHRLESTLY